MSIDHDMIIKTHTEVKNIKETTDRIENKMDCFDIRLRKKVQWSHLGIISMILAAIFAGIRYVPIVIAALL